LLCPKCLSPSSDFIEQGRRGLIGILLPPIGGETAGAGSGEDGLAKALEQDGNPRQALLAGVHFAQQRLQLNHYPPLLGEWRQRNLVVRNLVEAHSRPVSLIQLIGERHETIRAEVESKILRLKAELRSKNNEF